MTTDSQNANPSRRWLRSALQRVGLKRRPDMVLVYHMGKVGSTSIFDSLVAAGVPNIHHLNRLNPENIAAVRQAHTARGLAVPPGDEEGLRVYAELQETPHRIRCISPVRDPIRRNLSAFFFTSEYFKDPARTPTDVARLRDLFLNEYDHNVPLDWFDVEMQRVLGVDVYAQPFDKAQGHTVATAGACSVLLLKCEMSDDEKARQVREFLGLPAFAIENANMAKDKPYAPLYRQFLSELTLPEAYLDRMCNARFTRHFYTSDEIEAMRRRWLPSSPR